MKDSEFLKKYFMYKDAVDENQTPLFSDLEIQEEFKNEFNIDANNRIQKLQNLSPEQIQEMTSDAYAEPEDIDVSRKIWDVGQQALQGVTFGYGDEIEAKLRSFIKGTEYEDEIEGVRSEIEAFREENPGLAFSSEMAGAFLVPGFATAKLIQLAPKLGQFKKGEKLFNAMKRSIVGAGAGTVEGGLYGSGVAEEGERIEGAKKGAFWGSITGAGLGPTFGWVSDALASKMGSKFGMKGESMTDLDGNEIIPPAKPSAQKEAQDLAILASKTDDVKGLKKLKETLNEYIELMPNTLKNMTLTNIFDEGGFGQGLAELLAKMPGKGMKRSREIQDELSGSLVPEAGKLIKKTLGPRVLSPEEFKTFLFTRAKEKAKPFYKKADPVIVDSPSLITRINQMMGKRKEGMDTTSQSLFNALDNTIVELPRNLKEKNINAQNFTKKGGLFNNATILHWDTFVRKIDDEIKELKKTPGNDQHIGRLQKARKDIRDTLGGISEDYNKATNIHASKHDYNNAFNDGLKAHKDKSITPEFMTQQIQKLQGRKDGASTPEEMMYRLGYAWGMYQKILPKSVKGSRDPAAWLDLFSQDQPDKIRALFKDVKIADQFLEKIHVLSQASATANKLRFGSPTAPLQFMKEQMDAMNDPGIIRETINAIMEWGGGKSDAKTQARLDALTSMFTKKGGENISRIISDLEARDLENMSRLSGTYGSSYPSGVTGAVSPLYSGQDRSWLPEYDDEAQQTRRGILSGPMNLPNKMFGWGSSLLD